MAATSEEQTAMRRALTLAASVDLARDPNPRVGAVLLSTAGEPISEGAHHGAGTPHAEAVALAGANGRARGGTLVVTLEPCAHTGRTGPCTTAILEAGVARVVFAQSDPNPLAAGGAALLRDVGLDVEGGVLAEEAAELNVAWSFAMAHGRPRVTWKFAATLDGRAAAADGTSRWVSGPESRADTHRLRAMCDTLLVGTGTVEVDNPWLTVRDGDQPVPRERQPRRAVMGLRALDDRRRIFDDAADTVRLRTRDPAEALVELWDLGSRSVWLEGGPALAAAFIKAGLVDEVVGYLAPMLLGAGLSALGDIGISTMADALRLDVADVACLGDDVRLTMTTRRCA